MDKSAKLNFIFDFDWTIVMHKRFEEIIKYSVNYDSKKIDEYQNLRKLYKECKITCEELIRRRMQLCHLNKQIMKAIIDDCILIDGIDKIINKIKQKENTEIYIISYSFNEIIEPIVLKLGIKKENIYAFKYIYNEALEAIDLELDILLNSRAGKTDKIKELKNKGTIVGRTIMIGDGYPDIETIISGVSDDFIACTYANKNDLVMDSCNKFHYKVADSVSKLEEYIDAILNKN